MTIETFSTYDVAKIIGVSRSTIQQIVDRGIYVASIVAAGGKGTRNQFSREDVYRIAAILDMNRMSISQKLAADIARKIDWAFPAKPKILYTAANPLAIAKHTLNLDNNNWPSTFLLIIKLTIGNETFIEVAQGTPDNLLSHTEIKDPLYKGTSLLMMELESSYKQRVDAAIETLKAKK